MTLDRPAELRGRRLILAGTTSHRVHTGGSHLLGGTSAPVPAGAFFLRALTVSATLAGREGRVMIEFLLFVVVLLLLVGIFVRREVFK